MNKIAPVVRQLVKADPFLTYGLSERLLNLSRVAVYLRGRVAAVTKKPVKDTSILVALSRLQREVDRSAKFRREHFPIDSIAVHSDLMITTLAKGRGREMRVGKFYEFVQNDGGYLTITQGVSEIMLVFDSRYQAVLRKMTSATPVYARKDVSAVVMKFTEQYMEASGFFYRVLQPFAWMNVPILEISSSTTELALYVDADLVPLVFETVLYQHGRGRAGVRKGVAASKKIPARATVGRQGVHWAG